jgi:hypothetical protein
LSLVFTLRAEGAKIQSSRIGCPHASRLSAFEAVKQSGMVHPRPAKVLVIGFLKRGAWDSPQFFHSFFASLWCDSGIAALQRRLLSG